MKTEQETGLNVEKLPLDLNVPEKQAMGGYIPTFLQEHLQIMSILSNPVTDYLHKKSLLVCSSKLYVSLITDTAEREKLWLWFQQELEKRIKERKATSMEEKLDIEAEVAIELVGKVMNFVGSFITKPLEIGME